MLKRIETGQVTLGMFIHRLEGNWFRHPFWRARFLLTDPEQLDRLLESGVPAVIIDTDRGIDPTGPDASPSPSTSPALATSHVPLRRRTDRPGLAPTAPTAQSVNPRTGLLTTMPAAVAQGFGKAQKVADRGVRVVSQVFLEMRLGKTINAGQVTPVIESIIESVQSNPFAFNGLMRFKRDSEFAYRHALAVSALMISLGRTLRLSLIDLHEAGLAGLLLDCGISQLPIELDVAVGYGTIPDDLWRQHVALGADFIERSRFSPGVVRACREHHERFDGAGWPDARKGQELSLLGRMAAICDKYDLIATGSHGNAGLDPTAALATMKRDTGAYDPDLLAAFEATLGIWPTGSVLELRSGRLAVVISQGSDAPDKPLVAIFFDTARGEAISDIYVDLALCYGADGIKGPGLIASLSPIHQASASAALAATLARITRDGRKGEARGPRAA